MNRFSRQIIIADWQQNHLVDACVVIVGMGALGNEVARILAQAGVGRLILCDPDRIEETNLNRTILFRESDIGRLKVDAAADALKQIAPEIEIDRRPRALVHGIGLAELRDASLVVSCLDSRSARLQLAGRCQLVRAAFLDGGTHPWGGEVRPYFDPDGPCYGCGLGTELRGETDVPWSCVPPEPSQAIPAAAPSSALVGTWMAMIAVRHLMGLDCPQGTLRIDGVRGTTSIISQCRDPGCPLHEPFSAVERIPVTNLDPVSALRDVLKAGETPLAWEPVQRSVDCTHCSFQEIRWGMVEPTTCPNCGEWLSPRTTLELDGAPDELVLRDLGIPDSEILTVRSESGLRFVELGANADTPISRNSRAAAVDRSLA